MNFDFGPLMDTAVSRYKEKIADLCLECPHYHNCPPKRCPVRARVILPPSSSKATLFGMIRAYA